MGHLSQIGPLFSDFSPVSYHFHTFFLHSPQRIFGNFPQFPISPPFPPLSPHFSIFPIFPPFCGWLASSAAANADACIQHSGMGTAAQEHGQAAEAGSEAGAEAGVGAGSGAQAGARACAGVMAEAEAEEPGRG